MLAMPTIYSLAAYIPNEVSSVNGKEVLGLIHIMESDSVWDTTLEYHEMTYKDY